MYVFVRTDLSHPYQAVQATHAGILAARQSLIDGTHPSLVVLGLPNEHALAEAATYLSHVGIRFVSFYEDDIESYTAICTENLTQERRKLLRKYKLLT